MHDFHLAPVFELVKSASSQTMSSTVVVDELGSDSSNVEESMHLDEQGEFGVTWSASPWPRRQRIRVKHNERVAAMLVRSFVLKRRKTLSGYQGVNGWDRSAADDLACWMY